MSANLLQKGSSSQLTSQPATVSDNASYTLAFNNSRVFHTLQHPTMVPPSLLLPRSRYFPPNVIFTQISNKFTITQTLLHPVASITFHTLHFTRIPKNFTISSNTVASSNKSNVFIQLHSSHFCPVASPKKTKIPPIDVCLNSIHWLALRCI